MPGKYSDGFTKAAQGQRFIRHRDIKMKDSEIRKEQKVQKLMCEGVCNRCREKVQWRFRYDKYKSLKNPATCQSCKQKTVTKAYRTLCDNCALKGKKCPGCCNDMIEETAVVSTQESSSTPKSQIVAEDDEMEAGGVVWGQDIENGEVVAADAVSDGQEEDEEEEEEEEEREIGMDVAWNEKKFTNIAASKYSKHRQTGNEEFH